MSTLEVAVARQSPLVVTHGGTYRGKWTSEDAEVPVVRVETSKPVIFDGCTFVGRGILIESRWEHSDITIRNCKGMCENPNILGRCAGRFLEDESFDRVNVEHCELVHTAGIYLRDCIGESHAAIRVVANRVTDIDGRRSDGGGGYLNYNLRTDKRTNKTEAGFSEVQFLQLDGVHGIAGIDVGWNYVINEPGESRVEDNINLYNSSGTAGRPIKVHDNCIRGAYPLDPVPETKCNGMFSYDCSYSGGGIMLGDGATKVERDRTAYVEAVDNVVIATTNYGIAISAGHHISFERNVMVSSGVLADGRRITAQNVGAYVWNVYKVNRVSPSTFTGNGGRNNLIGWLNADGRNDWWTPDAAFWAGNVAMAGPITKRSEDLAEREWWIRAEKNGDHVGLESAGH